MRTGERERERERKRNNVGCAVNENSAEESHLTDFKHLMPKCCGVRELLEVNEDMRWCVQFVLSMGGRRGVSCTLCYMCMQAADHWSNGRDRNWML